MISQKEENYVSKDDEFLRDEKRQYNKNIGFKKFSGVSSASIISNFYNSRKFSGFTYGNKGMNNEMDKDQSIDDNM